MSADTNLDIHSVKNKAPEVRSENPVKIRHLIIFAPMKHFPVLLIVIIFFQSEKVQAQKRLIEKFLSNKSDTSRKASFIILPAAAYAQETGIEFGGLSITSFYMDKNDTTIRNSTINTIVTFTTKKQSNFVVKPDIWSRGNKYHYSGTFRYKNFPFNFYGTGDKTNKSDEDKITQKLLVINADVERMIVRKVYAGINAGYERYRYKDKEAGGIYDTGDAEDKDGGNVFYAGISGIYDSRNSNTYTTKGWYLKLNYSYAPGFTGTNDFQGALIRADLRNFQKLNTKATLGFNINYQSVQGDKLPFYLLPQLGNDQVMRGYYTGRYRDQNLVAAHTEFRYRFMTRFGIAAFTGTGTTFRNQMFKWKNLKPNYGAGIRYFVDPARGLTMRADYAVGEKRAGEARQTGFYLALSEAF